MMIVIVIIMDITISMIVVFHHLILIIVILIIILSLPFVNPMTRGEFEMHVQAKLRKQELWESQELKSATGFGASYRLLNTRFVAAPFVPHN